MATTTLPISLRGGLVPVLRYGNYAGPGYAGRLGAETEIKAPSINNGQPILASVPVQGTCGNHNAAIEAQICSGSHHTRRSDGFGSAFVCWQKSIETLRKKQHNEHLSTK